MPLPVQAPIASDAQTGWQTTVVSAATPAPPELTPRDPDARYRLVVDIQQQLRRVGCYWGRTDGSWGIGTKDALKDFTNRVNATLPLDEPDYVQLTLIQSHSDEGLRHVPRRAIVVGLGPLRRPADHGTGEADQRAADGDRAKGSAALEGHLSTGRGQWAATIQADADHGGFHRAAAEPHGDWRPRPNIGCRATERAARHAGSRVRTAGDDDRRPRFQRNRSEAAGDGHLS